MIQLKSEYSPHFHDCSSFARSHFHLTFISNGILKNSRVDDIPVDDNRQVVDEAERGGDASEYDEYDVSSTSGTTDKTHQMTVQNIDAVVDIIYLEDSTVSETLDGLDQNADGVSVPSNESVDAVVALETVELDDTTASETLNELDQNAGAALLPANKSVNAVDVALETAPFEDTAASGERDENAGAVSLPGNGSERTSFKMEQVAASLDETTAYYSVTWLFCLLIMSTKAMKLHKYSFRITIISIIVTIVSFMVQLKSFYFFYFL